MRTVSLLSFGLLLACTDGADTKDTDTDADGDGFGEDVDCDDADASVNPDADEVCDGVDNNCDGTTDEDATDMASFYVDVDADGFGASESVTACAAPSGYADNSDDCDDANAAIRPDADEVCDGVDNNCDGTIDEDGAVDASTFFADVDGDGFGDPGNTTAACVLPSGYTEDSTDCDDSDALINVDGVELCDTVDNDCDKEIDEDDAADAEPWYRDADGDGYGDEDDVVIACNPPSGYIADGTDCNDGDDQLFDLCFTEFDGTVGKTWERRATNTQTLFAMMAYHSAEFPYIYNTYYTVGQTYDPSADTWTSMTATAPYASAWSSSAPWDGDLWMMRNNAVYRYDPGKNVWSTEAAVDCGADDNATESDEFGFIYGYQNDGNMVVYDTATGTTDYYPTGLGSQYETRMAYDPGTYSIYFGAFYSGNLYRFDIASGAVSTMTSHPEGYLNDIFCSDRSGHIYSAGGSSGQTMWQYDIASDSWSQIPDLPVDHGNNWTCSVSWEGYLYVGVGYDMYRIELY